MGAQVGAFVPKSKRFVKTRVACPPSARAYMGRVGGWIAVVGSRGEGREDVLRRLARTLQAAGVDVGGFVQVRRFDDDSRLLGFDAMRVPSGEQVVLARHSESLEADICDWAFSEDGFATAGAWVLAAPAEVCFVEAGRLEAAERGHWNTIVRAIETRPLTVLGVRRSVLTSVALRLPDPVDSIELPAEPEEVDRFCARVKSGCAREDR